MPADVLELDLSPEPDSVMRARLAVESFAAEHGICAGSLQGLKLAVSEACTNVVLHAFRGREPGRLVVRATIEDGRRLRVTVSDDGLGMTPRVDSPGLGLGLSLIASAADDFSVDRDGGGLGTRLCMLFRLDQPAKAFASLPATT